jgi:hypothetical protein
LVTICYPLQLKVHRANSITWTNLCQNVADRHIGMAERFGDGRMRHLAGVDVESLGKVRPGPMTVSKAIAVAPDEKKSAV